MIPWDKLHGAMSHFPIALLLFSTGCDFASVMFEKLPFARGLRVVSYYGLAVAALASLGAVVSGIALTKGDLSGRDAGEDAPSLLKLQIIGAHRTLVIQSGIKGEMRPGYRSHCGLFQDATFDRGHKKPN
jgi:hypothetical protein